MTKRCSRCHTYKNKDQFNRQRRKPDGLRSECKECQRKWDKDFRKQNSLAVRERGRTASKKWRDRNRKKALAIERRSREKRAQRKAVLRDQSNL
jgi:hypothetical protein